jgi:hypothetical protein
LTAEGVEMGTAIEQGRFLALDAAPAVKHLHD